jgi:DNA-binding NarL/FixJ family response regulator
MNDDMKIINFRHYVKQMLLSLGSNKPTDTQIKTTERLLLQSSLNHQMYFHQKLTNKEIFCLVLAAKGHTMNETAQVLNVKFTTVQTWYKKIKKKLNCRSMTQAVFEGIRFGYLLPQIRDKE